MYKMIVTFCEMIFPFQALLGIGGNILNLIVLLSPPMRSRTNTMLAFAAVSDILFLVAMIPHNLSRRGAWLYEQCPGLNDSLPSYCQTDFARFYIDNKTHFTFIANWFTASSSWLMVAVSFDRLWAIKSPFSARAIGCSLREVLVLSSIFVFTAATNFHMNFSFKTVSSGGTQQMVSNHSEHMMAILTIINLICQIIIPMTLLITLNVFLIYYLRHRRQYFELSGTIRESGSARETNEDAPPLLDINSNSANGTIEHSNVVVTRNASSNSSSVWSRQMSKAERHVTVTVGVIVSAYVATHLPSALLYANLYIFHVNNMYMNSNTYTWVALSNFIVINGKVANFFLFCLSSNHFRVQMRKKLRFFMIRRETVSLKDSQNQPRTRSIPLNQIGDSTHNAPQLSH